MNAPIDWLMTGDPAIRWQTMRDLLDCPAEAWQAEQRLTTSEGWGTALLVLQDADGRWGGGIYTPKWTSTTYTLLTLRDIGIPPDCLPARRGAELVVDTMLGKPGDREFTRRLAACDRCVVGMILQLMVYFNIQDERVEAIVQNLLDERMPDGGWNCRRLRRPRPHHSSFNTTFNVLDGLRDYLEFYPEPRREGVLAAEHSALELTLEHKLYRSDKTGAVIDERFTRLSFPPRWHYDVLRGLCYFARVGAAHDPRLQDAIDLLRRGQDQNGLWHITHQYTGKAFFDMEKPGPPSRWNTLRALRVLRWWAH